MTLQTTWNNYLDALLGEMPALAKLVATRARERVLFGDARRDDESGSIAFTLTVPSMEPANAYSDTHWWCSAA
jgi:hypothetical protein